MAGIWSEFQQEWVEVRLQKQTHTPSCLSYKISYIFCNNPHGVDEMYWWNEQNTMVFPSLCVLFT